jgi:hypothetical protein
MSCSTAAMRRLSPHTLLFSALWLFIGFTSVHDGYLMVVYRDAHRDGGIEYNPVAQWLLDWGNGEPWSLLVVKACGTILACSVLLLLYWRRRRMAWAVAAGVACFQTALLAFILCS